MSVQPPSVFVIFCTGDAEARLLAQNWQSLGKWCGLFPVNRNAEVHDNDVILCLSCGGTLNYVEIPAWVKKICYFPGSADLCAAKRRLWPKVNTNGHGHNEIKLVQLFERGHP